MREKSEQLRDINRLDDIVQNLKILGLEHILTDDWIKIQIPQWIAESEASHGWDTEKATRITHIAVLKDVIAGLMEEIAEYQEVRAEVMQN